MMKPVDQKRPLKVFLCHAHADRDAVRILYSRLINDGVDAWLDKENLLAGQDWRLEIEKAVREADVVVVCLSKQFNQEGFRQREVRWALDKAMEKPEGEIFIIPARLEECDNLDSLRKWHWVDLFENEGYEKFLRALYLRGERIGAITYSLRRSDMAAEKERRISFLRAQARKMEQNAEWSIALNLYRQLKKIDPSAADVDKNLDKLSRMTQPDAQKNNIAIQSAAKRTTSLLPVGSITVLVLCCASLLVLGGLYSWSSFQTSSATNTPEGVMTVTSIDGTDARTEQPSTPQVINEMALVPAGEFTMGSDAGEPDELPVHVVRVEAFLIDIYEVTNAQYQACIEAGVCPAHTDGYSRTRPDYFSSPDYKNFPVIHVTWDMAGTYCAWKDARLPTEAEWEKAARGTRQFIYPWGNSFDGAISNFCDKNCLFDWANVNFDDGFADTSPVDSYPQGASVYGVYNLAGNVAEWVQDEYSPYPGGNPSVSSDFGSGLRVLRGGSWNDSYPDVRSANRAAITPGIIADNLGFRCAMPAP